MEHTILVVEDEQGIREAIRIYMKNQGYNVILAANGKEGLEKIETNDIHIITPGKELNFGMVKWNTEIGEPLQGSGYFAFALD